MKKIFISMVLIAFASTAAPVVASTHSSIKTNNQPTGIRTNNVPATGTISTKAKLQNPLKGVNSISELFYKIVDFIISLSYVVIAFFLIWSGFKFVAAQGSDDKLQDAKRTFYYTIIGALLIIGAQTIIAVLKNIFSGLNS